MGLHDEIGNSFSWMKGNDTSLIIWNPSYINKQKEQIYYNIARSGTNYGEGGFLYKFAKSYAMLFSTGHPVNVAFEEGGNDAPITNEQVNIKSAYKGKSFGVGISLAYTQASISDFKNLAETKRSIFNTTIGSYIDITSSINIDITAFFAIPYIRVAADDIATFESDGAIDYGGSIRTNITITDTQKLHVFFGMTTLNHSAKDYDPTLNLIGTSGDTTNNITGGVSDEIKISKNITAIAGIAFNAYLKNLTKENLADSSGKKYERLTVTLVLGLNAKLSDSWAVRMGINKRFMDEIKDQNYSAQEVDNVIKQDASANLFLGITKSFGNLQIDLALYNDLLDKAAFYYMNVDENTPGRQNTAVSLSATYVFETSKTGKPVTPVKKRRRPYARRYRR